MPPLNSYNGNGNTSDIICSLTQSQMAIDQTNECTPGGRPPVFSCSQYSQKVLLNLNALRQNTRFCDVEIVVGSTTIQAHRAVLSAASAYFEAMFRPELGLSEGKQKSVTLHSIRADILMLLVDFIYTGQVEIKQSNVQELLAAADMIQLSEVVDGCCEYLCRELHSSNALGILRFAEAHNCRQLAEAAATYVYTNFPKVALEDELLDIPHMMLMKVISSESLRVDSEFQVFKAALRWIKHDVVPRRRYVFEILTHVRLALVPVGLIDQAVAECRDVSLKIALRSVRKDLTSKRGQLVPLRVCPRVCAKKSIYIIGGSRREQSAGWTPADCIFESVIKYDIFRREWIESAPMQIGRILPGVASLGGKIFVIGGERGSQILANGEVYDTQNNNWEAMAPMIVPRCEFGLCALGGTLYAMGGWIGEDIGGSIECYDPMKNDWRMVGDLPEPRFSMGVVSFEGLIYIVGGCTTSSRHLPDLISYNPVTHEWNSLARMRTARCQMGVTILDRHLYVVGGNSSQQEVLCTVERYSFDDNLWSVVAPMSVSRASPAVAAADGLLYVAGGDQPCEINFYRAQVTISSFECYDPINDHWKQCPDLPTSRSEAGAVVV
ncbi:actin-binding protein IPP [Wyeomyia smithii]|uniref:actin-binding protein IPP n=1 Tax=Wyeomyia smithii TaxID=174621 RepID=UPI002467C105|nr:actin-binding protein IPP [Wyeomyia smithii]XP_055547072.1 actin-binding protein IPP [Wyeomyia smithii]XP_055547073.1 actin-binding protein IPP [Wyeomyia smithii]